MEGFKNSENCLSAEDLYLEKQYENPEIVEVDGQKIEVLDIKPLHQKIEIPVCFAPGYGTSGPFHIKTNILEMARLGRRTIFIDAPRGVENSVDAKNAQDIAEYFLKQISALIGVLDAKGIEKVDIVSNSEGGIYSMIAADLYPERFNDIVPCNTAGMIGDDSGSKLIGRFIVDGMDSMIDMMQRRKKMSPAAQKQMDEGIPGFQNYVISNPKASWEEIKAMASKKIRDRIKDVRKKGVMVSIIHTVDDQVFPMERIQKEASRKSPDEETLVDGFYSIPGGHGEFSINPEQYTKLADQALTALEAKRKKIEEEKIST
jgi:pimeloyl-ACP methyl ester carboxylesterase